MVEKRRTYLIQDPYDEDSVQFIRTILTYFGLRPVCFYTDPRTRFYGERQFRILTSAYIEASYDVALDELVAFSEAVSRRYEVLGVVPCREETVDVAARLCGLLGLDWNESETLARFRDKYALKCHVRAQDPGVRVPECRLVQSFDEVWAGSLPEQFVLKPNAGFGNQNIGIFDASARGEIRAHLAEDPDATWILEEYIAGSEFHIDGQIRANGEVTVLGLFEYQRTAVNGYATVYRGERQCQTSHPLFKVISDYARRLLEATGLRRCPFHLEVKVDERGPCVIDLGARFASEGGGRTLSRLHPNRPDAFAVAAHDYLGDNAFATEPVDWSFYDSELTVLVYGISHEDGIIAELSGLDEVEALPEFVTWAVKPRLGDRLSVTRELRGAPYIVELSHRGDERDSERLSELVRKTVRWNEHPTMSAWLGAQAQQVLRRAPARLGWIGHRAVAFGSAFRRPPASPLSTRESMHPTLSTAIGYFTVLSLFRDLNRRRTP